MTAELPPGFAYCFGQLRPDGRRSYLWAAIGRARRQGCTDFGAFAPYMQAVDGDQ